MNSSGNSVICAGNNNSCLETSRIHTRLMGSDFELIVVEKDHDTGSRRLQEGVDEIRRIERLLTEFSESSQTTLLNKHAGKKPVTVDPEVWQLIKRCVHLSTLTQGAFDISAGVLKRLYHFKERGHEFPPAQVIKETLQHAGYRHIRLLPDNKVFLANPGMHIAFGAIGKGYAADAVKALWKDSGVRAGVINASGDLTAWGRQPDGSPWNIGIADPAHPDDYLCWLPADNASVATSGNYEQYIEVGGIRYSHNIDPRTGLPVRGVQSVSVISPSAELSDALATAVTVMGKDAGFHLIHQLPDTHAILIDDQNHVYTTQKILTHAKI
jgi:FAD:protein FMN transferase